MAAIELGGPQASGLGGQVGLELRAQAGPPGRQRCDDLGDRAEHPHGRGWRAARRR